MSTARQNGREQNICRDLLIESCSIYSEINSIYSGLEVKVATSPQQISEILELLHNKQEQVRRIDDEIKEALKRIDHLSDANKNLLEKRQVLLSDNLNRNKAITLKAAAIKSHIQYEVRSMHTNRQAIKGYRPPEAKSRDIINRSF